MNKTQKRQLNLRNKLFAAIAMLLVSSIMMVSTTYAWFTLSTAPEVQGITTTVGANGNLEIALSPASGSANDIRSAMGDSTLAWTAKNTTWGNLLNLSDESYGLGGITLLPARLNLTSTGSTPLKTPVYGADGRVQKLEANTSIGKLVMDGETATYQVDTAYRGVRAIGTSSSLTKYQITFNNYLASMGQKAASSQDAAEISLKNNGAKLAEMAIARYSGDADEFSDYVDDMQAVIDDLQAANALLKASIRDAFIATAASANSDDEKYTGVMALVDAEPTATLEALMKKGGLMSEDGAVSGTDAISTAFKAWQAIDTKLTTAENSLSSLGDTVSWNDAASVFNVLMNIEHVKLNGYEIADFKIHANRFVHKPAATDTSETLVANGYVDTDDEDSIVSYEEALAQYNDATAFINPFLSGGAGAEMQLESGSGVYADLAVMVGNLYQNIQVDIDLSAFLNGMVLSGYGVTIVTNSASSATGHMGDARTHLATLGALTPEGNTDATGVLNETYGYIVDFYFRTNASNSDLLLQTDPAQRVYENGNSDATLGNGSSMTFRTGAIDGTAVNNLMKCIRVVFLDTASGEILGIGALDMDNSTQKEVTAATETTAAVMDITAKLYLCADHSENADTGVLQLGALVKDKTSAKLCALPANTAKAVSVLVYLDGDSVTNADVANAATSTTGTLNLQFASSAELVPMDNEALKNMAAEETTAPVTPDGGDEDDEQDNKYTVTFTVNNAIIDPETTSVEVEAGQSYTFKATPATNYDVVQVTYGGRTYYDENDGNFTVTPTGDMTVEVNGYVSGNG